jgi:hypothetical protein
VGGDIDAVDRSDITGLEVLLQSSHLDDVRHVGSPIVPGRLCPWSARLRCRAHFYDIRLLR